MKNKSDKIDNKAKKQERGESLMAVYRRRFNKHLLGKIGAVVLILLYTGALLADFLSPYDMTWTDKNKSYHPPTSIYWFYKDGKKSSFKPFVYEKKLTNVALKKYKVVAPHTMRVISVENDPGRAELWTMSDDKDIRTRRTELLSKSASYYNLDLDSTEMQKLAKVIDEVERAKEKDLVKKVTINESKGIDGAPIELMVVKGNKNFVGFFNRGIPYKFLGLIRTNTHLFGSPTGGYFAVGADSFGRDVLSRLLHGSRVSLSVGIFGAIITFIIGLIIGGLAGYFGGATDTVLMRICEIIISVPSIYLLFALRSSFPPDLNSIQVYLLIIVIMAFFGWASLARVIRGLVLSLKNEEYVLAARSLGLSHFKIIRRHIIPNTFSYVIIRVTLTIPGYILGESALSLLGLGITEPQSSWGLMLAVARNMRVVQSFPWILAPGFLIFVAIMAWNFFGDGIRDAVDPKSKH